MTGFLDVISGLLLIAGAALILVGAVGSLRLPDVLSQLHATAVASTSGLLLVLVGAAVGAPDARTVTTTIITAGVVLVSVPAAAHLLARAVHRNRRAPVDVTPSADRPAS